MMNEVKVRQAHTHTSTLHALASTKQTPNEQTIEWTSEKQAIEYKYTEAFPL